jgi:hypothetical protein
MLKIILKDNVVILCLEKTLTGICMNLDYKNK